MMNRTSALAWVPKHEPVSWRVMKGLQKFLDDFQTFFVLTGAGVSTESGLPDYRSKGIGKIVTNSYRPITWQQFLKNKFIRQRFWARNFIGWPGFASALPNRAHFILKHWEDEKKLGWLVTQNVDALHTKVGSSKLTELHGSAHRVKCISCGEVWEREKFQLAMQEHNPTFMETIQSLTGGIEELLRPDGDFDLKEYWHFFRVPPCHHCGGVVKPDVVFFGENVPKERVSFTFEKLKECHAVLVIGTSLEANSAYRYLAKATTSGQPVAIVNIDETKHDVLADVVVRGRCSEVLARLEI